MNTDAIFDAVAQAARTMALDYKIAEKKEQIASVTECRCGNCALWMTSRCKPEKRHGQFKCMNSWGCGDFRLSSGSLRLQDQFTLELAEIKTISL